MHQVYDDETTFKLVGAASQVSGLPMEVCLEEFGKHFLVYCQKNGYDQILRVLGSNLYDFLTNLDNLHDHLASIYPGMRAPSFRVTRQLESTTGDTSSGHKRHETSTHSDNASAATMGASMYLHYYSERNGLSPIVKGLVLAVAREFFSTEIVVTECKLLKPQLNHADDHVVLKIDRRSQGDILFDAQTAANIEVAATAATQQAADVPATGSPTGKASSACTPTQRTMLSAMYGDSLSKCAGDSLINSEIMMQSFPFHVIFDQHFNLVQVGKSLLRVTSAYWRRRRRRRQRRQQRHAEPHDQHLEAPVKFSDLFAIVRPKIEFTFDAIADHTNQVFVVKTRPLVLNADFRRTRVGSATPPPPPPPPPTLSSQQAVELPPMCPMSRHALKRRSCVAKLASDPDTPTPEVVPQASGGRVQHNTNDEPSEPVANHHLSVRLKGQMIILTGDSSTPLCLYLCSPRVDHLNQLLECGLTMSDLALHDRARELMLMSHTHKEDREAVKKLDQATNDLKKMDTKLRQENKRTNEVLHNIFPAKIATLLSHGTKVESESFDPVTCLYSDIIGFTKMCGSENVRPIDIVRLLNTLYLQFDNLTNIHGVYKVETIGDAYVIVGGLPEPIEDHADRCVKMGLDMVKVIATVRSPADNQPIQMRIGIHSGPVMAGIVGIRVPRYSLFGNTTTLANQLETHGVGGKIHISDFTLRNLIKRDRFVIEDNPNQLTGFPYKTYFVTNYLSDKGELQKHERILEEQLIKDFEMMGNEVELVEDSSRRVGQQQMSPKLVQRQAKELRQQSQPTTCKAPSDNNQSADKSKTSKRPLVVMDVEGDKKKVGGDKQLSEVIEISTLLSDKIIAEALEQAAQLDQLDRMLVTLLLAGSQQLTSFYPAFERTKTAECIARAAKSLCVNNDSSKSSRDCPLCDGSGKLQPLVIEQLLDSLVNRKSQPEVVEQSSRLQELLVGLGAERARLELQVARLERLNEERVNGSVGQQLIVASGSSPNPIIKPEQTLSSNIQRMKRMDTLKRRKMKRVDEPEKELLEIKSELKFPSVVDSPIEGNKLTRSTISELLEPKENESSDGTDSMNVQQFIKSDSIEEHRKRGQHFTANSATAKQLDDQSKSTYQMLRASIANIISDSVVVQLDDSGAEDSTARKKRFSLSNFGSSLSAAIVSPFSSPRKTSINTTTTTTTCQKEVRLQAANKNHDSRPATANSANVKLGARDNHRRDTFRSNSNCSCLKSSGSSQSVCSVER